MKKIHIRQSMNAISFKLVFLILLTVVPMAGLAIYNNNQSREVLLDQVENTRRNMLDTYVAQIDNQMTTALSYIINMGIYETDPQEIAIKRDSSAYQFAKVRLSTDMSEKLLVNNYMDGFFVFVKDREDETTFINSVNWQHTTLKGNILETHVRQVIDEQSYTHAVWQPCTIAGNPYLIAMTGSGDNVWAGAYVSLESLISHLNTEDVPGSLLQLIPTDELTSFARALPENMQCVSSMLKYSDMALTETFSRDEIMRSLPFMQKYTLLITGIIVILFILLIVFIRRLTTKPLLNLSTAMKHIQNGNLDYRIPLTHSSTEVELVNKTFNQMVSQVQDLKIGIYEEQLKVQKSQLRNLQMQIKPHFLINSLNMVYNLIETHQTALACRLIQCSIDYFRYMVKVDKDMVALNDEVDHIKAYLNIQSIRYEKHFSYDIQVEPLIDDMLLPPVMLQTFVENSIKYALSFTEQLHIRIRITSFEKDYFPYARIVIADNGRGYPEEELESLNTGVKIIKKDGSHTGIRNTVQRLKILFGEKAVCRFYNEGGAVTEVIMPATFPETEDDDYP